MTTSLLNFLPPEAQPYAGVITLTLAIAGILLAVAGLKIARFSVAMILGILAGGLGAWLIPAAADLTPLTGLVVGFVIGALAGALGFRLLQGIVLASCIALATAGTYYRFHIIPQPPASAPANVAQPPSALINQEKPSIQPSSNPSAATFPTTASAFATTLATTLAATTATAVTSIEPAQIVLFARHLYSLWNSIPSQDQNLILLLSVSTSFLTLLLAFSFPHHTTFLVTSLLGSIMILASAQAALQLYSPQTPLPTSPIPLYIALTLLTLLSLFLQHHLCWPSKPQPNLPPTRTTWH